MGTETRAEQWLLAKEHVESFGTLYADAKAANPDPVKLWASIRADLFEAFLIAVSSDGAVEATLHSTAGLLAASLIRAFDEPVTPVAGMV